MPSKKQLKAKSQKANDPLPPGMHRCPLSGHVHPVGEKHEVSGPVAKAMNVSDGTQVHGEETDSVDFLYQKVVYKEGE